MTVHHQVTATAKKPAISPTRTHTDLVGKAEALALDGPGLGKGGTGVLSVDGKEVARKSMEHSMSVTFPEDESFDVGMDTRSGVAMLEYRYDPPFKFTGKIDKLTFKLEPELKDPAQAKAELGPTAAPEPDPIEQPAAKQPASKARK